MQRSHLVGSLFIWPAFWYSKRDRETYIKKVDAVSPNLTRDRAKTPNVTVL